MAETQDNRHRGFIFASAEQWIRIQREGLQPYIIERPELREMIGTTIVKGIWLRTYPRAAPSQRAIVGAILHEMAVTGDPTVLELRVRYNAADVLKDKEQINDVRLHHSGRMGRLVYQDDAADAIIVTRPIPRENIELLDTYKFHKAWSTVPDVEDED